MCIVIDSDKGVAQVQDIIDEIGHAGTVQVLVDDTLEVGRMYMIVGSVSESSDTGIRLIAEKVHDISRLDIKEFKRALELEEKALRAAVK
ncbi:MAG: hypothetical protein QXS20_01995 [Candidatus Thorarchaeota archaeon]